MLHKNEKDRLKKCMCVDSELKNYVPERNSESKHTTFDSNIAIE